MKCSNCGSSNANITYEQNINGEVTTLKLCEKCAQKLGIFNSFDNIFSPMVLDLDYILPEEIKCKGCGYTLSKYKSTGLFGCDECYNTFKKEIDSILLKIQGKNRMVKGKEKIKKVKDVVTNKKENEIDVLKNKLKEHIEKEEFEEAAKVRDEIKELENKNKGV